VPLGSTIGFERAMGASESLKSLQTQSREGKDPGCCASVWTSELGEGGRKIGPRSFKPGSSGVRELTDRNVCLKASLLWTRPQDSAMVPEIRCSEDDGNDSRQTDHEADFQARADGLMTMPL
jgi:hypothetical protein